MWAWIITVKGWLSVALLFIKKILGSPQSEMFFIILIQAATGLPAVEVKALWNLLYGLCAKAETDFPAPGSGDKKYAQVMAGVKAAGIKAKTFDIDFALHNVLAEQEAEKRILAQAKK